MSNRWLRFGIAFLAIVAAVAAGYRIFQQEQRLAADLAASRQIDAAAEASVVTLADLKAALHAYVAEGQGDAFWTARAATLIERLRGTILELDATTSAVGAPLSETLDLTDRLASAERRARDHVRQGQRLMAGEVIFTEARDMLDAMRLQVAAARSAVSEQRGRAHAETRREQATLALAAAGILAFATLLLVIPATASETPLARPQRSAELTAEDFDSTARVLARAPAAKPATAPQGSDIHPTQPPASGTRPATGSSARTAAAAPSARSASGPRIAPSAPSVSLRDAAAVCTDLGRVSQSIEIAALLERGAKVLNASGAIVWLASPDRTEMYPAASAGYDERLLARIGAIARDASNVTASAFRDAAARTSQKSGSAAAALAVPLLTPLGPVGVLSAELRDITAVDETRLAVATIFAAQLASLLGSMAAPAAPVEATGTDTPAAKAQA